MYSKVLGATERGSERGNFYASLPTVYKCSKLRTFPSQSTCTPGGTSVAVARFWASFL